MSYGDQSSGGPLHRGIVPTRFNPSLRVPLAAKWGLGEETINQAGTLLRSRSATIAPSFLLLQGSGGLATSSGGNLLGDPFCLASSHTCSLGLHLLLPLGFNKLSFGDTLGGYDAKKGEHPVAPGAAQLR